MTLVREFHEAFDNPHPDAPTPPDQALVALRRRLIAEECKEVLAELDALRTAKSVSEQFCVMRKLLKELVDLRYVVDGCAVSLGLPIDEAFEEVHRSNMSKLGPDGKPILREDGKVMKGPNYIEADMEQFVPEVLDGSVS
jgi:predicted HAD superfamily Cof-like phosphohydrolase